MGREALSQAEIASLSEAKLPPAGQAAGLQRVKSHPSTQDANKRPTLDFACADRLSPRVMLGLEVLSESAARDFAASLALLVRAPVTARVSRVVQVTYAELVRELADPTCAGVSKVDLLGCNIAIDIGPAIVYPIIDRLLGSVQNNTQPVARPLTQIERRLAARVLGLFQDSLRRTWSSLGALECELSRVETNPRLLQIVSPSEMIVVAEIELSLGAARGIMRLCIPSAALEPLRECIAPVGKLEKPSTSGTSGARLADAGGHVAVEVVAELASQRVSAADLAGLGVGDIITTDISVHTPLVLRVDGVAMFHARPGAYKGRKAISIVERIDSDQSSTS